jgi:hypothetical protein
MNLLLVARTHYVYCVREGATMLGDRELERKFEELDLTLFRAIPSQSSDGDKKSWLALQRSVRAACDRYVYLEIGSYQGGSMQPYLVDPKCQAIYSIDDRSLVPADDRGKDYYSYDGNSKERMLENLRKLDESQASKVMCFDGDAKDVDVNLLTHSPNLCFIDGEHTKAAVLSDFDFCLRVASKDAIIYFHDDWVIFPAIAEIIRRLKHQRIAFRSLKLGGITFAILLGESPAATDPHIRSVATDGRAYLIQSQIKAGAKRLIPAPLVPAVRRAVKWIGGN